MLCEAVPESLMDCRYIITAPRCKHTQVHTTNLSARLSHNEAQQHSECLMGLWNLQDRRSDQTDLLQPQTESYRLISQVLHVEGDEDEVSPALFTLWCGE